MIVQFTLVYSDVGYLTQQCPLLDWTQQSIQLICEARLKVQLGCLASGQSVCDSNTVSATFVNQLANNLALVIELFAKKKRILLGFQIVTFVLR